MNQFETFLRKTIAHEVMHAKWINTLSYLENCGARKIAACENPTLVKEEVLKHAAEEFRHAHYLKRQIARITTERFPTYERDQILGGVMTKHYLNLLDLNVSRYLKLQGQSSSIAYWLVTYAIELRASDLYPLYDKLLREKNSPITVRSILLEEHEHLNEMRTAIEAMPNGLQHANYAIECEHLLFHQWENWLFKTQEESS